MIELGVLLAIAGIIATIWAGWPAWKSLRLAHGGTQVSTGRPLPAWAHVRAWIKRPTRGWIKRPTVPKSYMRIANSMQQLMRDSDGDFPGSMTKNLSNKVLLAAECANILKDHCEERDKIYFAMSTTCHVTFEVALYEGLLSHFFLEIYTSSLPLLLSAQINRIHCIAFGRQLVHEYASLTFGADDRADGTQFDCAFFGARGVVIGAQEIVIRTCKQEHCGILRDALSTTKKAVVVCFDSSKFTCADGSDFIRISKSGPDYVKRGRRAKLYLVTDVPSKDDPIATAKFNEFAKLLQGFGFARRDRIDCVVWVAQR